VRWSALFADLELQLEAAEARGRDADVAELTRAERASVALVDRLRASQDHLLRVGLVHGGTVTGLLRDAGQAWFLLADGPREHLVPLRAVAVVAGLADVAAPPDVSALRRLGLGHVLRAVARDRSVVRVATSAGTVVGRVDAVGADHVDLAPVRPDTGRPTGERQVVPFDALAILTRG